MPGTRNIIDTAPDLTLTLTLGLGVNCLTHYECNSTPTSEIRGETLTPNPKECNSTLTSKFGGVQLPNPNECHSTLTSVISGINLTPVSILGFPRNRVCFFDSTVLDFGQLLRKMWWDLKFSIITCGLLSVTMLCNFAFYQAEVLAALFKAKGEKSRTRSARDWAASVVQSRIMVKCGGDENPFKVGHYSWVISLCTERGEGKGRGKGMVGMAKDFDFKIPVIYVMFKLTIWVVGTDDRVILNFEPWDSCFKNQNKKFPIGIFWIAIELKRLNLDLLSFSRLQMIVLPYKQSHQC